MVGGRAEGEAAGLVRGWGAGGAGARVEVLGDGIGGALEGCCACAEGGLADEGAQVLRAGGHFGRVGGVVVSGLELWLRAAQGGAQGGRFGEEVVRHFVGWWEGWMMRGSLRLEFGVRRSQRDGAVLACSEILDT